MLTTKEIIYQLLEMGLDMDYMDYVDTILDSVEILTNQLEDIKEKQPQLYDLLDRVVVVNGSEELPLLERLINEAEEMPHLRGWQIKLNMV